MSAVANPDPPILIAGAGPTGLTAALELSRFHLPVRIIDKAVAPATTSRAIGIQARTLELMEMRGLADEFVRLGLTSPAGHIYGGGKKLFSMDFSGLHSRYPYVLFLSQTETERILRERLQALGITIEFGVELAAFRQDDTSITAVLRHQQGGTEDLRAAYLIDAEGAHSMVRTTLGIDFQGKTFDQSYVLGDLHIESELSDSAFHIFSSLNGFMALFPFGQRRFRMIADHSLGDGQSGAPALEECQSIYDQRSHIPGRLHDLIWSSYFHINSRMVSHLRMGRVFLAGDAAHVHSPAGAQGMNTGIQDAINLAWKLAYSLKGQGSADLLDTYESDRLPVMRRVLDRTERLTEVISSENPLLRSLFNHLAPIIVGNERVRENASEQMSQLAITYRDGVLSEDHGPHHGVHAGDRIPDVPLQLVASSRSDDQSRVGQTVRLFELLDASKVSLLYLASAAQASDAARIEEAAGIWGGTRPHLQWFHIAKPEGADPGPFGLALREPQVSEPAILYLIRPDGYVGFRGQTADLHHLERYLARWLGEKRTLAAEV